MSPQKAKLSGLPSQLWGLLAVQRNCVFAENRIGNRFFLAKYYIFLHIGYTSLWQHGLAKYEINYDEGQG